MLVFQQRTRNPEVEATETTTGFGMSGEINIFIIVFFSRISAAQVVA
jgi:hypothetical protein